MNLYTEEQLVSLAVHPKTHYIVISTSRGTTKIISRLVLMEINSQLNGINELSYIKFNQSSLSQRNNSYLRTLRFHHMWGGSNPALYTY
jgi:hypothetical protein